MRGLFACALALAILAASPQPAQQPYEINVFLALTGSGAFLGQSQVKTLAGLESLINEEGGIKGRPVRFAIQDNQTNPQVTVQLAQGVIAKKVPVMLVSGLVASCQAIAALVKDGPVMYCLSPALYPATGSFVFSASVSTKDLITALARYFRGRGWRRIATITSTDTTGQDADRNVAETFGLPENRDLSIVDQEHFAPSDVSVSAQLAKIKAANAQAILVWTSGTPFGTVLRGIKDAGIDAPIVTTNGNLTYAQMRQYTALLPRELYFPAVAYLANQAANGSMRRALDRYFSAAHSAGVTPDTPSGNVWDPAMIVIDALRHIGPNATADDIRRYILALRGYAGISGIYDFRSGNQRGLGARDVVVVRWNEAKGTWVAASKFGGGL